MNILIIYSRDIDPKDSGGSRTTVLLANYLANCQNTLCYCLFKILDEKSPKICEIPRSNDIVLDIMQTVIEKKIDILLVPEASHFANVLMKVRPQLDCKVISAFHNKPGYEKIGLFIDIYESMRYNIKIWKRVRALAVILGYPIYFSIYTKLVSKRFHDAYSASDRFVLLSKRFFPGFKKEYKLQDGNKLCAIENPLSFDYFANLNDIENKEKVILVVSRLNEAQKRISIIIKAWSAIASKYPDWSLFIVGDGRSSKTYRSLANRLHTERISFLGRKDPRPFYLKSSIFLMSSAYEGWGMTITEAQQFGCVPIVMDSYEAIYEIIEHDFNGMIIPNKNLDSFISGIEFLIENKEYREKLALNGIASSKQFSPEIILQKWVDLFVDTLANE